MRRVPHPGQRDLAKTAERLREWLAGKFAARGGTAGIALTGLRAPSGSGFSSDTLLFEVEWREARGGALRRESLVARLEPQGFNVFPEYDVARQYRVMAALAATDVPVPRMRWLETDPAPLGVPFYAMDRVEGRGPGDSPPYHASGWLADELSPAARERLWWSGLEAMARVHRLDWRAAGLGFLDRPERGRTGVEQTLREYEEFFAWGMRRERYPLIQAALDRLRARAPRGEPTALCWGDARISNQLFQGERCAAVIDWEMAHLGNPVHDLAWFVTIDRCLSEGLGIPRLAGFPSREATCARWEELVGWPAEHVEYYELLSLAQFSIIMARIGLQLKHYGLLPPEHDMDVDNLASQMLRRELERAV
jgi:aminoglycoside phosphotransferase (APT) family kinase protein